MCQSPGKSRLLLLAAIISISCYSICWYFAVDSWCERAGLWGKFRISDSVVYAVSVYVAFCSAW